MLKPILGSVVLSVAVLAAPAAWAQSCAAIEGEAGSLEAAAIAAAKASPPPNCLADWRGEIADRTATPGDGTLDLAETWTVAVKEKFVACYEDHVPVPVGHDQVATVTCTARFACAGDAATPAGEPDCAVGEWVAH